MSEPRYIAMWSGPRNISTAMMRSWENRTDTIVHDEPFYAYYLQQTGIEHPGRDEIIAVHETDPQAIIEQITSPLPDGKNIYYQKHMTHHMLQDLPREWMLKVTNCFLIREPIRVVNSLAKVLPDPDIDQTGFPKQLELFDFVRERTGEIPPVIDTRDILMNPRSVLTQLCERIGIPFDEAMLSWPGGPRESDGVWAKHWYASVEQSTGFMPYQERDEETVPDHLKALTETCETLYQQIAQYRIQ